MPYIEYLTKDGQTYQSMFEGAVAIDEFLAKTMYVNFEVYGFKNIYTDFENPYDLDMLYEQGNYQIYDFINGPDALAGIYPVRVYISILEDKIYQFIPYMLDIYHREGHVSSDGTVNWASWTTVSNLSCPLYCGETEPTPTTPYAIWIDISIPKYPVIYAYQTSVGWFGVGSLIDIMDAEIYDTTHRFKDMFLYLEEMVGMIRFTENGYEKIDPDKMDIHDRVTLFNLRAKFKDHFKLGHMSIHERAMFDLLVDDDYVNSMVEKATETFKAYVADKIESVGLTLLVEKITTAQNEYNAHRTNLDLHPSWSKQTYWNLKAESGHEHILNKWVTLHADDVTDGVISMDRMPDEAIDIMKRVLTHADRFKLTEEDVQNGDSVFVSEQTEEYDAGLYLVYDQKHLDSDEGYIYYKTRRIANIDYEDISLRPNTLDGFGIIDGMLVIKDSETGEFVYEYEIEDRTLNYALTVAVRAYYAHVTKILDDIESKMNDQEIKDIWTQARSNYDEYIFIKNVWDRYRYINNELITDQHDLNVEMHNQIEDIYNSLHTIVYGNDS